MTIFRRIACAVSGGVDSSVSAYLLKTRGYEVIGVYMRNWDIQDEDTCTADKDAEDAAYVCKKLDIPFKQVNFVKDYWNSVFTNFVEDYEAGLTPNPDILCNKNIKFDSFFSYAMKHLNADAIATGHYANTSFGQHLELYDKSEKVHLLRGIDAVKDQTFFLSQVAQEPLARTMFPIGRLRKSDVKKIASQTDFEHLFIKPKPGDVIDIETGKIVQTHNGIHLWTIGQKFTIAGQNHSRYIVEKNPNTNTIYVAPGRHHPSLYHNQIITDKPHWIHSKPFEKGQRLLCWFCFQHRNPLVSCTVTETSDNKLHVLLETPLRALTPGQFAVFYSGDICFGSAKILSTGPSLYNLQRLDLTLE
uniref:tRNA-5-taurinomethyluridine 2-sulfurtransferase n=1 Tax=Strigamia maritima TaxID=126957 RepID=T1JMQ1_STRMM